MSKPRKKYLPRAINPLAGFAAIQGAHDRADRKNPLTSDQSTDLGLAYRLAFDAMCTGHASEEHWAVVACSLNIAAALSNAEIGGEYQEAIDRALAGAFRSKLRASSGNGWGFDGEAMTAIKFALDVHDAQIEEASKQELVDAIAEVHRRANEGIIFKDEA